MHQIRHHMMRTAVLRILVASIVGSLLLPIVLGVVLGLAALLTALGDDLAAVICRRSALAVGVCWCVSVVVTAVTSGVIAVDAAGRSLGSEDSSPVREEPR